MAAAVGSMSFSSLSVLVDLIDSAREARRVRLDVVAFVRVENETGTSGRSADGGHFLLSETTKSCRNDSLSQ